MLPTASTTTQNFQTSRYPCLQEIVALPVDAERSLAEQAANIILTRIITGDLAPGTRLKSTELSATLGMSRTPVAAALAQLASDGVLLQEYNHMAVVAPDASDWLIHIHQVRQLLEPEAATLAAGKLSAHAASDLLQLVRDAKPIRGEEWRQAAIYLDFALHLTIAEFCGNRPLATAIRKCWSYKRLSYGLSDNCRADLKREYAEHQAILEQLLAGRGRQAGRLMAEHLSTAANTRAAQSRIV